MQDSTFTFSCNIIKRTLNPISTPIAIVLEKQMHDYPEIFKYFQLILP